MIDKALQSTVSVYVNIEIPRARVNVPWRAGHSFTFHLNRVEENIIEIASYMKREVNSTG